MVSSAYSSYQLALALAAVTANAPALQISPPANVVSRPVNMGLVMLRVVLTTAVATSLELCSAATAGVATTTTLGNDVGDNNGGYSNGGSGSLKSTWSAAPTAGAAKYAQASLAAAIGATFEWAWPESNPFNPVGLRQDGSSPKGVLLRNILGADTGAMIVTARWLEYKL